MVSILWLAVSDQSPARTKSSQNDPSYWETGWSAPDANGATEDLSLPVRLSPSQNVIVNTLPATLNAEDCLFVKTGYQQVKAEVDGITVPVTGVATGEGIRLSYDLPWSLVSLTPDMAGKPIRLTFSNTGSKPFVEVYTLRLGSVEKIRLSLLSRSLPTIILSLVIILFALGLFAFALVESLHFHKRMPAQYYDLLAFLFLAGLWFYSDTDISGVSYLGSSVFLLLNLFSYLLMPVPFLLYIGKTQPVIKRSAYALGGLIALSALAQLLLIAANHYLLWAGLMASHALLALSCLVVLVAYLRRRFTRGKHGEMILGFGLAVISGVITLALFYILPMEDNTSVFRYGVMALVLDLTITLFRSNVDLLVQSSRTEQLRVREEEYHIAARQSQKYLLRFDVTRRAILPGEGNSPLSQTDRDTLNMPEAAIASGVVPENCAEDFRAFFNDIISGKPYGSCTVSLRSLSGLFAWYHAEYTLIFSDDGNPLQAVITLTDITEERQMELAYRRWKKNFTDQPSSSISYYEYNLSENTFSDMSGELFPPPEDEAKQSLNQAVGQLAQRYVHPEDAHRFRAFLDRERLLDLYESGKLTDQLDFRRVSADGEALRTQVCLRLMPHPSSGDVLALLLFQDEENGKRNRPFTENDTESDALTGLMNRAALEKLASRCLETAPPEEMHALLLIGLDGFKRVNDVFGHTFGDRVLQDIANNLRAMMRSEDLIARGDGDEFIICLKSVRDETDFLERRSAFICQALGKQLGEGVSITGSVGVAIYPKDGTKFDVLFQKADMALYGAKHSGKNRLIFFDSGLMSTNGAKSDAPSAYPGPWVSGNETSPDNQPERTLLLADASEECLTFLQGILQRDYRLIIVRSAEECLLSLQREPTISAVLMDLDLPGAGGTELLERIRLNEKLVSLPVIVTAAEETELGMKAIELGAADMINKPFNPRLVRLRVKNAIRRQETEDLRVQNRFLLLQKNDESRHQNELRYIAEHDPLTSICNKAAFYRKTKLMLDAAPNQTFLMIAFDIEKFRLINDIFGHEEGNRLLRYIAQRMQALYSGAGTYGRIDADNFVLCVPYSSKDLQALITDSDRNLREYGLPFEILLVYGLYIIDDRTLPVSIMHDRAEMAKRTVKGNYLKRYAYYDDQLRQTLLDEQQIINDMTAALQQNQFEIFLQPKCVLATGEIVGAEALVRWNHPTRGLLMPGTFVPIFEKNGFIMKMDAYVWEQVCKLIRRWMDRSGDAPTLPLSMNISRVDIYNPALVRILCDLAERYRVPRRFMELEITESAYAEDPKQLSDLIATLRREGFTVEMDDFGSAYSSLNMLKEIPVDSLKLDMRFLYGTDRDGRGGTILSSIVRMARYLSLPIVAEGVETSAQARFLSSIGCSVGQGFLYYKPVSVSDFEKLVSSAAPRKPVMSASVFPESAVRRVWSIDGDFNLMLSTIPCAASMCEMNGNTIELLRINEEYLSVTGDKADRLYRCGTNVRALTTDEDYQQLFALFRRAFETQDAAEGTYHRLSEENQLRVYKMRVKYLTGDAVRSLYFVTYLPMEDVKSLPASAARLTVVKGTDARPETSPDRRFKLRKNWVS